MIPLKHCTNLAGKLIGLGFGIEISLDPEGCGNHGKVQSKASYGEKWRGFGCWFGRKSNCILLWSWFVRGYKWSEDWKSFILRFYYHTLHDPTWYSSTCCACHHVTERVALVEIMEMQRKSSKLSRNSTQFIKDGLNNNGGKLWYDQCQLPESLREMLVGAKLIVNPMNCYRWFATNRMIVVTNHFQSKNPINVIKECIWQWL